MADTYVEWMVARKIPGYAILVKGVMIAFIAVSVFLGLFSPILWVLTVILGVTAAFVFPSFSVEWEYIYLGDAMNVDRITNKSKRKELRQYEMAKVELVAMKNSAPVRPFFQNPEYKVVDYTSQTSDAGVYAMIYMGQDQKEIVLFEPNEKLLNAMKYTSPRKVIIGA